MQQMVGLRFALVVVMLEGVACAPGTGHPDHGDDDDSSQGDGDADGDADGGDGDADADSDTDADGDGDTDADGDGDADADGDADGDSLGCEDVVEDGCGGAEVCGDQVDNDCNGQVDEGCECENGATQSCFVGPPGRRGVGGCVDGTQVCHGFEFSEWTECDGGIVPEAEVCDGKDNDCNGCVDDIADCLPEIECPVEDTAPPLHDYPLSAGTIYDGAPQSCHWEVECPLGSACAGPANPDACDTTAYLDVSGDYTVTLTFVDANGQEHTCTWIVHVLGLGLRVEMSWEGGEDDDDVDLQLHREANTGWFNEDDCHWANCSESTGSYTIDWGYAETDLADCPVPPPGSGWDFVARGSCPNPRLDIDDIDGFGPENINLDNPAPFDEFRVAAHYYDGGGGLFGGPGTTNATIRIFCGGVLKAQVGPAEISSAGAGTGDIWRVADVVMDAAGTDCDVTLIERNGNFDVRGFGTRNSF